MRRGLGVHVVHARVSRAALYKRMGSTRRQTEHNRVRVLPILAACAATVVYSIPSAGVHRQTGEQVSGTTRLCDPAPGEGELGFGEALRATAHVQHHGSSSLQVRRRGVPSDLRSASAITHRQHRGHSTGHDQYICIVPVRIS